MPGFRLPRFTFGKGHGVNGSTSVSKTESLGSNPSAPAKQSALGPDGYSIELDGVSPISVFPGRRLELARPTAIGWLPVG